MNVVRDFANAVSTGTLGDCYAKYADVGVCERGWKEWSGTRRRQPTSNAGVYVDVSSPRAVDLLVAELALPVGDRALPALALSPLVVKRSMIGRMAGIGTAARGRILSVSEQNHREHIGLEFLFADCEDASATRAKLKRLLDDTMGKVMLDVQHQLKFARSS